MDDFEQFLKSRPLRAVPPEWRGEILAAAKAGGPQRKIMTAWQAWLWPSPYAWGALAAVWVAILGLNLASRAEAFHTRPLGPQPTSQEIFAMLAERRRMFEEFQPGVTAHVAVVPPPAPQKVSPGAMLEQREPKAVKLA